MKIYKWRKWGDRIWHFNDKWSFRLKNNLIQHSSIKPGANKMEKKTIGKQKEKL